MREMETLIGHCFEGLGIEKPRSASVVVGVKLTNAAKPCAERDLSGAIFSNLSETGNLVQSISEAFMDIDVPTLASQNQQ